VKIWQCGRFALNLERPKVMGILNLTPDSFSDGNRFAARDAALARAEQLIDEGADLLDLGAESTRPGASAVPLDEELSRLMPVLEALAAAPVPVSVDTYKAEVMRAALAAGASVINDIWGLRQPGSIDAVRDSACGLVVMHMQGEPATMQEAPRYADVLVEVKQFLESRLATLYDAGIEQQRVVIDPGFGFGKRAEDNAVLLRRLADLDSLDACGVLAGLSRKSMLGAMTGRPVAARVGSSIAAALLAFRRGARIIRCHDVAATVDALNVWQAFERPVQ
jgi:dihydropteroate synthase